MTHPPRTWHLLTGEYPPTGGGVGEYTELLARALEGEGREVHVWAPADAAREGRVEVHPVPGFGRAGLRALDAGLDAFSAPRTLLVQYAPQAFGARGMNLAFCRWVLRRARRGDDVRVMFHEPFVPFSLRHPQWNVLAAVHRAMAAILLRAARRVYVSTPAWERRLRPWAPRSLGAMPWLPVPSTVPRVEDLEAVVMVRAGMGANRAGMHVIGHFGTYGGMIAPLLEPALLALLSPPATSVALLLGDGGPEFAARLERQVPALRGRLFAPGRLPRERISVHLQACDVAVQPYPDGVSARRTTVMAPLANGVATVTTSGVLTEEVWRGGPVTLVPAGDPGALAAAALDLLDDPPRARRLGAEGRDFYERNFSLRRTLDALLES